MRRMLVLVIVGVGFLMASCLTATDLNRILSLPAPQGAETAPSRNECASLTAISPKQLVAGIQQAKNSSNPVRESKKYNEQRFKVTGTITGIGSDVTRTDPATGMSSTATRVFLDSTLICRVPRDSPVPIDSLDKGQKVTVCGVLDTHDLRTLDNGKQGRVLRNCYIIQH